MTNLLTAALHYAALGYHVFPCRPGTKIPAIASAHPQGDPLHGKCRGECGREGHGLWDAKTDPEIIRRWWSEYPDANIGLASFRFTAPDIDVKHGNNGHDSWARLLDALGITEAEAETWYQDTPTGGRHYIYRHVAYLKNRTNFGGAEYPGLDLRSTNGYILAAPSVAEGNEYVACVEDLPPPDQLPEMPPTLAAFLSTGKRPVAGTPLVAALPEDEPRLTPYGAKALESTIAELRAAPVGTRNDALLRRATRIGALSARGHIPRDTALDALRDVAAELCPDELDKAIDTVDRGFKHGYESPVVIAGVPIDTPEKAAYVGAASAKAGAPLPDLPGALREHAEAGAKVGKAPRPQSMTEADAKRVKRDASARAKTASTGGPLDGVEILDLVQIHDDGDETRYHMTIACGGRSGRIEYFDGEQLMSYRAMIVLAINRRVPLPPYSQQAARAWHELVTDAFDTITVEHAEGEITEATELRQRIIDAITTCRLWTKSDETPYPVGLVRIEEAGVAAFPRGALRDVARAGVMAIKTKTLAVVTGSLGLRMEEWSIDRRRVRVWAWRSTEPGPWVTQSAPNDDADEPWDTL